MLQLTSVVILFLIFSSTSAAICPPPSEMGEQCICIDREEGTSDIVCHEVQAPWDVKAYFDHISNFINDDAVFEVLRITYSDILEIPADTIKSLKFRTIWFVANPNLNYISPDAINPNNTAVVTELGLQSNSLTSDIFEFVRKFENVERIDLGGNEIRAIPDGGFANFSSLEYITMGDNGLNTIGRQAFAQSPNVGTIWLWSNNVSPDGISVDTFEGAGAKVSVLLNYNPISYLPEDKFKNLLDSSASLAIGTSDCPIPPQCPWTAMTCDSEADWLCENQEVYRQKLRGFFCTDYPERVDIFDNRCNTKN